MTRPQSIERIREALEAGPTPEWFAKDLAFNAGYALLRRDKSGHRTHRIDSYGAFSKPDGEFIAACNPSAIKELLTYLEGVERDAARYKDALKEIALAGMSPSPEMSEDGVTHWHASQAWHFIRIAARAISPPAIAKEPKP